MRISVGGGESGAAGMLRGRDQAWDGSFVDIATVRKIAQPGDYIDAYIYETEFDPWDGPVRGDLQFNIVFEIPESMDDNLVIEEGEYIHDRVSIPLREVFGEAE